jgi:hypothetical protein
MGVVEQLGIEAGVHVLQLLLDLLILWILSEAAAHWERRKPGGFYRRSHARAHREGYLMSGLLEGACQGRQWVEVAIAAGEAE